VKVTGTTADRRHRDPVWRPAASSRIPLLTKADDLLREGASVPILGPVVGHELAAVLTAAQSGSEAALTLLWRDANPALLRYLRVIAPDAAEDIAAETWLQVVRGLPGFRGTNLTGGPGCSPPRAGARSMRPGADRGGLPPRWTTLSRGRCRARRMPQISRCNAMTDPGVPHNDMLSFLWRSRMDNPPDRGRGPGCSSGRHSRRRRQGGGLLRERTPPRGRRAHGKSASHATGRATFRLGHTPAGKHKGKAASR